MADKLRWGILATGSIAHKFADGVRHSRRGVLTAVGSRKTESAEKFAEEFDIPRAHGSYEDLLADDEVDAVYVAVPHPMHAEWAIAAAEAGKHVLCEKPLGINAAQAQEIIDAADRCGVFLMEAFMYRMHPQTKALIEMIREDRVGEVRMIYAAFGFNAGFNPEGRLFKKSLGGGGILDVGCYCTNVSRLVAGVALGQDFADPTQVKGCGRLGESGIDEWAIASLQFPGDIVAQVSTAVRLRQDNFVRVFGSEGYIEVPVPWIPNREGGKSSILVYGKGSTEPEEVVIETDEWLYGMEADKVADDIPAGQPRPPAVTWEDTLGNMRTLDRWRAEIGLRYEEDDRYGND